jgi:phytol kinase
LFSLFIGLLWLLGRMRCRWGVHPEVCRKITHVAMGMACLAFPVFVTNTWQILCLAAWFAASLALLRVSAAPVCVALDIFRATRRCSMGEFYFIMGVTLAFILADGDQFAYSSSVLLLAFADAAAGTCGRMLGKIQCWGNAKTLEGSIAFATVGLLCMVFLTIAGTGHPELWICALVCAASTMAEGLATQGSDNLWIPLTCVICLRLPDWLPAEPEAGFLGFLSLASLVFFAIWILRRIRWHAGSVKS